VSPGPAASSLRSFRDLAALGVCALSVVLIARSDGGWWPTTWGWAAFALLFVTVAALVLQPAIALGRLDYAFLGGLGAFTAWTGLSWFWSESPPRTMLVFERTLVYFAGVAALLCVARRRSFGAALGGLLAADVALCAHAVATRLVPDHVGSPADSLGFRLAGVFASPNALGIVAVLGLLLAAGFVADGTSDRVRGAAAASTVPLVLALSLANSRGSGVALGVGILALLTLAPARRRVVEALLPLVVIGALAIWLTSRSSPVTDWTDPPAAAHDGHLLAVAAVALACSAAAACMRRTRWTTAAALVAAALAIVVAPSTSSRLVLAAGAGGPLPPGAPAPGTTTGERLVSTTSNSRREYWRVAFVDFGHHPVAGSGAGTYVREWYRHRTIKVDVQNAHSLYVETLAELGVVGLALLLFALATPALAATRIRGSPYAAGAFGAYVASAAHTAVDWDWALPAVTLAGLFCGAMLVVAARPERGALVLDRRWRSPLLIPLVALLVFSFVGLVGNHAEASAFDASGEGDWKKADAEARRARSWAPWSSQALVLLADAAAARNDTEAARSLLRHAVEKDPHDFLLWARLSQVSTGDEQRVARERTAALNPLGEVDQS
jgi:O-antigen ligase